MIYSGKFSLVEGFIAAAAITCQFTTSGLAQPLVKGKYYYIIEHNVSIIQLPVKELLA